MNSRDVSTSRRDFLRTAIRAGLATSVSSFAPSYLRGQVGTSRRKVVIVTFGGGARDEETFSEFGQRNIPMLVNELAPQGTFFTQVLNRGILGHYVATASIATGTYERFDNFVAQRPANPTIFEYLREGLQRSIDDAWLVAPSANFLHMNASDVRRYGPRHGAQLVLPKQLLDASIGARGPSAWRPSFDLLRDNYESDYYPLAVQPNLSNEGAMQVNDRLRLKLGDFEGITRNVLNPDELSLFVTQRIMNTFAPSLLFVTFHDIDVAHLGAFSLYLDAIRRTDTLCGQLWKTIQSSPEYKDRTTLLILPDFGRDGDEQAGGNGFQHHRTGSAMARTTWMLALGLGVHPNTIVERPVESVDIVPTVGAVMGFPTPYSTGKLIPELR